MWKNKSEEVQPDESKAEKAPEAVANVGGPSVAAKNPTDALSPKIKRAPGTKEIIPLVWKLVGMSDGMPVTLLKCTDREDAEAQMERLRNERYYEDLAIYDIDAKIVVPEAAIRARKRAIEETMNAVDARADKPRSGRRSAAKAKAAGTTAAIVNSTPTGSAGVKTIKDAKKKTSAKRATVKQISSKSGKKVTAKHKSAVNASKAAKKKAKKTSAPAKVKKRKAKSAKVKRTSKQKNTRR